MLYIEESHMRIKARCLKITEKVLFDIASEASYVYIFSSNSVTRQKLVENAKMRHFE